MELIDLIKKYNSIVIFRHVRPDLDALGSQIGLKHLILNNFNDKKVYVVGDMNSFTLLGEMDEVTDEVIKNSLAIICDVAEEHMVSDDRFKIAKERFVIDHHKNQCNIDVCGKLINTSAAAATQIVTQFAIDNNLKISSDAATALYSGMITDSGRFLYSLSKELFMCASVLIDSGAEANKIYKFLYSESLFKKKMRAYFVNKIKVNKYGLGYIINNQDVYDRFNVDSFTISRGMVNVMADVNEIKIWANFTKDKDSDKILCEFRSKEIPIVDVAKKYGGGGHSLACGCTINSKDTIKLIMNDFNKLLKG